MGNKLKISEINLCRFSRQRYTDEASYADTEAARLEKEIKSNINE